MRTRKVAFSIAIATILPIIAAAAYEIEANRQHIGLIALERTLQSKNIDNMPFDPTRETLVIDGTSGIDLLITYQLPTVLERDESGTLVSYTLATRANCDATPSGNFSVAESIVPPLNFCIAKAAAPEPVNILEVGTAEPFTTLDGRPFFANGPTISFIRNGRRQGTFTAGSVDVLPYLPRLAVGCSPTCRLSFVPERVALDALSSSADSGTSDPLPIILGLTPRSPEELAALGWPQSDPAAR